MPWHCSHQHRVAALCTSKGSPAPSSTDTRSDVTRLLASIPCIYNSGTGHGQALHSFAMHLRECAYLFYWKMQYFGSACTVQTHPCYVQSSVGLQDERRMSSGATRDYACCYTSAMWQLRPVSKFAENFFEFEHDAPYITKDTHQPVKSYPEASCVLH